MARYGLEKLPRSPRFIAGGSDSVELPQRHVLAGLLGRLDYDYAVAGGTGAGSLPADAQFRLIDRVNVRAFGNDIQQYSGPFLYLWDKIFRREALVQVPPTLLTAGADQDAREFWAFFPFQMAHAFNGEAWGLPTAVEPAAVFEIYWKPAAELAIGEDGAIAITNANFTLYERMYLPAIAPPGGFRALLIRQHIEEIAATGERIITLDHLQSRPGNQPGHALRAIFIEAYKGGAAGSDFVRADDVVTRLRFLVNGAPVVERTEWRAHQQLNRDAYQLPALEPGVVVLDAAEDRKVLPDSEVWVVSSIQKPQLTLDVTKQAGDNKVVVTTVYSVVGQ
jgi:hypothetical protein